MSTSRLFRWLAVSALAVGAFGLGRWTAPSKSSHASLVREESRASAIADGTATAKVSSREKTETGVSVTKSLGAAAARPTGNLAEEEERQQAIERWAEVDPRAAIDFARSKLKGDRQAQATAAVLAIWGKNDPDAAWNWVSTEMPSATHHFDTLLEVFGRNSTELAGRYAAKFAAVHPEAALEVHLAALLGVTHRGDFVGARALAENSALDAASRATLNNFIAGQWARFAPEDAKAWVMTLPAGPQREQALVGLGESWSEVDPAAAASFAVSLPAGATRTLAMRQAIAKWVMTDPEAARAWVMNTHWHEDFDQAVGSIATDPNLVNRDPARALKWAGAIFDDALRSRSVGAILHNWYPADPAAATAYVQASPEFTPEQRADLLGRLQAKN